MHVKPVRYQDQRCLHFIAFSCYHRMKLLDTLATRDAFELELEHVRRWYGCYVTGYVAEADHLSEAEATRSAAILASPLL
jgi:hypothetical protein